MTKRVSLLTDKDLVTGLIGNGGIVTQATSTSINISAGAGVIITDVTSPRSYKEIEWGDLTNISIPAIASANRSYILIGPNGQPEVTTITPDSAKVRDFIYLAEIVHPQDVISFISNEPIVAEDSNNLAQDVALILANSIISGGRITPSTTAMEIDISQAVFFDPGVNYRTSVKNPNFVTYGPFASPTLTYITRNGEIQETRTTVNPNSYDVAASPVAVQPGRATVQRFYASQASLYVLYGQNQYKDLNTALANLDQDELDTVVPSVLSGFAFLGYIVVTEGTTDLNSATSVSIINVAAISDFAKTAPSASRLSDLVDVDPNLAPNDREYLVYDADVQQFKSTPIIESAIAAWTLAAGLPEAQRTVNLPGTVNGVIQPVWINLPKGLETSSNLSYFDFDVDGDIIATADMFAIQTNIMVIARYPGNASVSVSVGMGDKTNLPNTIGVPVGNSFISRFRERSAGNGTQEIGARTFNHTFAPVGRPNFINNAPGVNTGDNIVLVFWSNTSTAVSFIIDDIIFSLTQYEAR